MSLSPSQESKYFVCLFADEEEDDAEAIRVKEERLAVSFSYSQDSITTRPSHPVAVKSVKLVIWMAILVK